jgi:hypothetical protein
MNNSNKPYMQAPYMTKLKGKDYMIVAGRVMWFRDDMPNGSIITNPILAGNQVVGIKAEIVDSDNVVLASGLATVRAGQGTSWQGRELEKAETAAIGRALAHAGYGTQFALEDMSEGDYLADSPIQAQQAQKEVSHKQAIINEEREKLKAWASKKPIVEVYKIERESYGRRNPRYWAWAEVDGIALRFAMFEEHVNAVRLTAGAPDTHSTLEFPKTAGFACRITHSDKQGVRIDAPILDLTNKAIVSTLVADYASKFSEDRNEGVKVMLDILQVEKFSDYQGELKQAIRTLDQAVKA